MRVTLTDRETRANLMRQHVEAVARSIVEDHDGDAVFERYLSLTRYIHHYSVGNRMLIAWQSPDSRLVASRSAFDTIARMQEHHGRDFSSRKGKRWVQHVTVAAGARAVWVWGPTRRTRTVVSTDAETGEETREVVPYSGYIPVDIWAVEDIRYADTGEPMEAPDFVQPVENETLYRSLLAFAADRCIAVTQEGLNGPRGVSRLGSIALQSGDPVALRVAPLIHEIGHELLHDLRSRLQADRRRCELHEGEAEAVCAVVLTHCGHPVSGSAAYMRAWKVSPHDVIASMDRIATAAGQIVSFMEQRTQPAAEVSAAASLAVA